MLSLVRGFMSRVRNHFLIPIRGGWLSRAQERAGNVRPDRKCDSTRVVLDATVNGARRCQMLATAASKHGVVGSRHRDSNMARTGRNCRQQTHHVYWLLTT